MESPPQNPEIWNNPEKYCLCKPWHQFNHTSRPRCTQKICMQIKVSNLTQKVARRDAPNEQYHCGEPRAFRGLKMADTCQTPRFRKDFL